MEWVKKQRPNGSIYYFNVMTGAKQTASPNHLDDAGGAAPPPLNSALGRIFQVRKYILSTSSLFHVSCRTKERWTLSHLGSWDLSALNVACFVLISLKGNRSARLNSGPLPAGWVEGTDGDGKKCKCQQYRLSASQVVVVSL